MDRLVNAAVSARENARASFSGFRVGAAIEDAEGRTHFVTGTPDRIVVRGDAALQVKCKVDAAAGAHRVRLAYATTDLSWRASYRVDVAAGADGATATVQPTFTIAGASVIGARRASVSLLTGLPGGEASPGALSMELTSVSFSSIGTRAHSAAVWPRARAVVARRRSMSGVRSLVKLPIVVPRGTMAA